MRFYLLPALALLLLLTQCKKNSLELAKPEDQLPPATQTGARTFGCLLNGQLWVPSGNSGMPNFRVTYDPAYDGGNLDIRTYRVINGTQQTQFLSLGFNQISQPGTYRFQSVITSLTTPHNIDFNDGNGDACYEFISHRGTTTRGELTITRLDKQQGIVSGTFAFTLLQPGCDTIRVTKGRFDNRF
jgi:hypothetical protein